MFANTAAHAAAAASRGAPEGAPESDGSLGQAQAPARFTTPYRTEPRTRGGQVRSSLLPAELIAASACERRGQKKKKKTPRQLRAAYRPVGHVIFGLARGLRAAEAGRTSAGRPNRGPEAEQRRPGLFGVSACVGSAASRVGGLAYNAHQAGR